MSEFPILCGGPASMWPPGSSGASKGICGFARILKVWRAGVQKERDFGITGPTEGLSPFGRFGQ